jgi:type VI protein secretion system component VasK
VFAVVNVALLVLRRQPVSHAHFRTWTPLAVLGALTCAYLAGPWARSEAQQGQYVIAGALIAIGVVLSGVTYLYNRAVRHRQIGFEDVSELDEHRPEGPLPRR